MSATAAVKKSTAREYLESIVVALILAVFVRTFVVQAFKIPSSSMEQNLLIGDHILVNRLVYSPSAGKIENALLGKRTVARGHVVIFKYPDDPSRDFVKRVIGLPGETVEVRDKRVIVDGKMLSEAYVWLQFGPLDRGASDYDLRVERLRDNWGPKVVPQGEVFVMGDNRDNSQDSRYWGFLPIDQIKGRALVVYWSYNATREEYQARGLWAWLRDTATAVGRTRWSRFFHLIR